MKLPPRAWPWTWAARVLAVTIASALAGCGAPTKVPARPPPEYEAAQGPPPAPASAAPGAPDFAIGAADGGPDAF